MKKTIATVLFLGLLAQLQAGILDATYRYAKDKAKEKVMDKAVDKAKDKYQEKREARLKKEKEQNIESNLSKTERVASETKKSSKEAAVESFGGQENVDYLKRGAGYFGKALRGEQID